MVPRSMGARHGCCWFLLWLIIGCCRIIVDSQVLQSNNACRLLVFLPLVDDREGPIAPHNDSYYMFGYGTWPSEESLQIASFGWMAATELAIHHFNTRNGVLVKELWSPDQCSIQLTSLYRDSGYSRRRTIRHALESGLLNKQICSVIGPVEPHAHEGLSVLTEAAALPQIGFKSISSETLQQHSGDLPTFVQMLPYVSDFAASVAKYIQRDVFQRNFVAIVYDVHWGEQLENALEDYLGRTTMTEHFEEGDQLSISTALGKVARKGYRTIILVLNRPSMIPFIAETAEELGLLGKEYFWVLSGDALPPSILETLRYELDSPPDRLLRGAALFTHYDQFVYNQSDAFLDVWKSQNSTFVERLNDIKPSDQNYTASLDYFQTISPTEYSSFIYDSVISAGLSACRAQSSEQSASHFEALLQTQFTGASGQVQFSGRSRDPGDMVYGVYNLRPGFLKYGTRDYKPVLTSVYSKAYNYTDRDGRSQPGAWRKVPGSQFLFYDGTTNEPLPLVTDQNPHYLSFGTKVAGMFFSSLAVLLILMSAVFVYVQRNTRLIQPAQPDFLYILCFGSVMVACSAFFISFDEDKGYTEEQLSMLCSAFPWCFVVGYLIMYCSLFSKLWRLSRILQMRRRKVGVLKALVPFSIVIACSILVLVVWQIIDPLVWERKVISEDPFETYGQCRSTNVDAEPFLIPLAFLIFLAVAATAVFSWRLRDVQSELSMSKWIFAGTICHIQIWIVGVAIAVDTGTLPRDSSYLMFVAITWFFSVSQVAIVIWPRAYIWANRKFFGGGTRISHPRLSIAGGSTTRVSGLNLVDVDSSRFNRFGHSADQTFCSVEQGLKSAEKAKSDHKEPQEDTTASCGDDSKPAVAEQEVTTVESLRG